MAFLLIMNSFFPPECVSSWLSGREWISCPQFPSPKGGPLSDLISSGPWCVTSYHHNSGPRHHENSRLKPLWEERGPRLTHQCVTNSFQHTWVMINLELLAEFLVSLVPLPNFQLLSTPFPQPFPVWGLSSEEECGYLASYIWSQI